MPGTVKVGLSRRAEDDLAAIADYTIERFGVEQARLYRDGLERAFWTLAQHPQQGRSAGDLVSGLRRFECQSHIVFYVPRDDGVNIVRILHQRMDIKKHF